MFRNSLLLATTCLSCLFIGEIAVRTVFPPIDFLKVDLEHDPILAFKIPGGESGHDDLGFRNKRVPAHTDVLAIGDSMTYGNMATTDTSWPAHMQALSGKTVYNAGIGGYGPLHYLHNLQELAPKMSPDQVIMTLYVGNDFLDAYNLVYSNENWAEYRRPGNNDHVEPEPLDLPNTNAFLGETRDWLAKKSVIYRLATQSTLFDKARIQERSKAAPLSYIVQHQGQPVLLSQNARPYSDLNDPKVREGLDIAKRAIQKSKAYCEDNNIDFRIAIMPVRENVFYSALPELFTPDELTELEPYNTNLDAIHSTLGQFLESENISFVDLKPALETAIKSTSIYPASDGHPNGAGYEAAAKAMLDAFAQSAS